MQRKKILFMISLPPQDYKENMGVILDCISQLRERGVDIRESIRCEDLKSIVNFDTVIIVSHYDNDREIFITKDGIISIRDFISSLPESFSGDMDLASCYSATIKHAIIERCPNCNPPQGSNKETRLKVRLLAYPFVVDRININKDMNYHTAYDAVLDDLIGVAALNPEDAKYIDDSLRLGKKETSIYAPSAVKRNTPFLIQIFFHNDEQGNAVDIEAKRIDPLTGLKETLRIPLKLKKNDIIYARLIIQSPEKNLIKIEDDIDTKSVLWSGDKEKITFCVIVDSSFSGISFVCKLMMEVNSIPIGESYFTIGVAEKEIVTPADIVLTPHDFRAERSVAKEVLLKKLSANLLKLQKEFPSAISDAEKKKMETSIRVCKSCISLLQEDSNIVNNPIKKVFVSSTSDMKLYRDIVKNEIEACNMYPEMYENWPQSGQTPKNECCRRVIESDILFCILGSKYGDVEPTLGMSMTEIEYRTALEVGKTILVCIIDPLNASDEPEELVNRQKDLIEEIRSTRIIKFFSNTTSLAKDATRNLSRL